MKNSKKPLLKFAAGSVISTLLFAGLIHVHYMNNAYSDDLSSGGIPADFWVAMLSDALSAVTLLLFCLSVVLAQYSHKAMSTFKLVVCYVLAGPLLLFSAFVAALFIYGMEESVHLVIAVVGFLSFLFVIGTLIRMARYRKAGHRTEHDNSGTGDTPRPLQ